MILLGSNFSLSAQKSKKSCEFCSTGESTLTPEEAKIFRDNYKPTINLSNLRQPDNWESGNNQKQGFDSKGTEFWLTMMRNHNTSWPTLYLDITSVEGTTGSVEIAGIGYYQTFSVVANSITRVNLPAAAMVANDEIVNKGIHVLAENEVTVYGMNQIQFTTDAFLGLPVDILSTQYLAMTYTGYNGANFAPEFAIVSPYDNNTIQITPTSNTYGGFSSGTTHSVVLNAGQVYQVIGYGDLTGSIVQSSLPVAFFSGNSCTNIPSGFPYCDHIVEQIPPNTTWGSTFVTQPLAGRMHGDTWRFLAAQDNTILTINGSVAATLNFGDFYETILESSAYITSSYPILSVQFANGNTWDPEISGNGDPFMMVIPPYQQFMTNYAFATPSSGFILNKANITVESIGIPYQYLDNVLVNQTDFNSISASDFSGGALSISVGTHTSYNSNSNQFGIYVYGLNADDSYGYPGGLSLDFINQGGAPIINLTQATIDLIVNSQYPNVGFNISALVIDNEAPFVQSASLYYRQVGNGNFTQVSMIEGDNNIWSIDIPGPDILYPGMEFYFLATDGQLITTKPGVNPQMYPYAIAIKNNEPPIISHVPVTVGQVGVDVSISCEVFDETDFVDIVELNYRKTGGNPVYTTMTLTNSGGNNFGGIIPGSVMTEAGIDYYIRAVDNLGVAATSGSNDEPHTIGLISFWESHLNNGIAIQVIETAGSNDVKYVGYKYRKTLGGWKTKAFAVSNTGFVFLSTASKGFFDFYVTFDNQILLWDKNPETDPNAKQLGHIKFEYSFEDHSDFTRNAIIIFHNDDEICENPDDPDKHYFPYGAQSPDYPTGINNKWNYFMVGEYPVSMLIPPSYKISNNVSGYKMPENFDKKPILFVHGLLGTFSYQTPAKTKKDEVSYWFNTERIVNNTGDFQGWQFYYPNTMDIHHASLCLKFGIENYLIPKYNQKLNLVTHSMGGLVTMEYLTLNDTDHNKVNIGKVLLSAPPIHGSYGANKQFKTGLGRAVDWLTDQDKDAPCYRDMSMSSDFMLKLHSRNWNAKIDFNSSGDIFDDLFVVIMNTRQSYKGFFTGGILKTFHQESLENNDAIVSISSASLIDHNIGFATLHGNHDDGRFTIDNLNDENILPNIIINYFNDYTDPILSYDEFIDYLDREDSQIDVIYSCKNNDGVLRPEGQTIENLQSSFEDVDYQKGLISYNGIQNGAPYYYGKLPLANNILMLKTNGLGIFIPYSISKPFIEFKLNQFSNSYYGLFNEYSWLTSLPKINCLGNGLVLPNQPITVQIFDNSGQPIPGYSSSFDFSNCKSHYLSFESPAKEILLANNETDNKLSFFNPQTGQTLTSIFIDDQTDVAEFSFYSEDAWLNSENYLSFLEMPDGTVIDSASALAAFNNYQNIWNQRFIINNPMPGEWKAWGETVDKNSKSSTISVKANLQTELIAFTNMADSIYGTNQSTICNFNAGLLVNDTSLLTELKIFAVIVYPNQDTSYLLLDQTLNSNNRQIELFKSIVIDTNGYYLVKFNFTGIYNGFNFERVVWHNLIFIDNTSGFILPDLLIDSTQFYHEIKLNNYVFGINDDSISYSFEVFNSTFDTSGYYLDYDSINKSFFVTTDLSANGIIDIKWFLEAGAITLVDTMQITVDVGLFGQSINLIDGWSIISSYQNPDDPQLNTIFTEQITNSTMQILLGKYGFFWPGQQINTIGNWNPYEGYKVKMNVDDEVLITGEMVVSKTVNLATGVNYLPVLDDQNVVATDIFNQISGQMLFAFDILNNLVYWPAGGLYTLQTLEPGKGYLVSMTTPASVTFPETAKSGNMNNNKIQVIENSPWTVENTGVGHIISIEKSALSELNSGDIVAAFNSSGLCVGVTQLTSANENLSLVVYGDDFTTSAIDGMIENEAMTFKVYNASSKEVSEVTPVWNIAMPNADQFAENGLSAITTLKSATSITGTLLSNLRVFPNPNSGLFNIYGIDEEVEISVLNTTGQIIESLNADKAVEVDLSKYAKGIYYLKIVSGSSVKMEKIIIK
jgi:pimeloyl-ACP methyl ester carboxylesterase